jgi:signal peptidase II
MTATRSFRWLLLLLAVTGVVVDQASKYAVFNWLYDAERPFTQPGEYRVIDGVFHFQVHYLEKKAEGFLRTLNAEHLPGVNTGALNGTGREWAYGNLAFAIISAVAAVAILFWSSRPGVRGDRVLCAALGLILAGTLGNLYDRLVFDGVRDFLHWHYQSYVWPTFNLADCFLVCGAGLLLGHAFFAKEEQPAPAKEEVGAESAVMQTSARP